MSYSLDTVIAVKQPTGRCKHDDDSYNSRFLCTYWPRNEENIWIYVTSKGHCNCSDMRNIVLRMQND
jgi:hypothetical protein